MPDGIAKRDRALAQIDELMAVLQSRKDSYRRRRPAVVNLIAAAEMERFLRNGSSAGSIFPTKPARAPRAGARRGRALHRADREGADRRADRHRARYAAAHELQIFRQPDRKILALSPFRLGEEPNIRTGVAMITSAPEALALPETMARELWASALKAGRGALHPRHDGEIILHRESGEGDVRSSHSERRMVKAAPAVKRLKRRRET